MENFELGKLLGNGAFGSVNKVIRKSDRKEYAMKRVKLSQLEKKEKENALNEVRILASIDHKNIIGYKEAFFDDKSKTLNIVMEYADGGDLNSKIKEIKQKKLFFEEKQIWSTLIQILQGLNYLHKSCIIHRDLKSANIFLTKDGAVKIGDFPIFENLLSGISQLGYWGNNEFIILMVIAAALIAFIYRLSFGEFVESFIAGIKKMLPTAIYAALASIILSVLYQASYQGTGTIADTVFNATMSMTDGFNVLTTGLTALIGSFFYNDLYYLLSGMQGFMSGFDASTLSIAGLLVQSVYALGMILLPTSVVLIAGLSYFDVSFKQWIKYIWKFAVIALLVILLVCAILTVL